MIDDAMREFLDLEIERDVPCVMTDGVTLYADVYRPRADGPFPVLLMRKPYDKTKGEANVGYAHPSWYARHGYVVVVQDCRGRWTSEGTFYPFRDEAEDGYATIEWAARLPGTTGRVGMYGFSYPGATQLLAAVRRPPSLVTICPGFTGSQYYEGWTYNGGAFALAFATTWAMFLAMDAASRDSDDETVRRLTDALYLDVARWNWKLPFDELRPLLERYAPYFFDWLDHSSYDEYWSRWSIDERYAEIQMPALHIGGWYDAFVSGVVRNFVGLRRDSGDAITRMSQKLLIGPWYHMPWIPLGEGTPESIGARLVDDWQLRWFDHFLKGIDSDVLRSPVTVFVIGRGWEDFDDWPPSNSTTIEYFMHSEGRANSFTGDGWLSTEPPGDEPPDIYTYDPLTPNLSQGGHSCCWEAPVTPMGPTCQASAEAWPHVLVYTSAPLDKELVLVGDVVVTLFAVSSASDTDFTARLCVVDEKCSINIQEGIIRARFRESSTRPSPITPGRLYSYEINLGPVGLTIPLGRRLRVDISSSDFPQWDRNMNTGDGPGVEAPSQARVATQMVVHNSTHPSRISLPVLA